MALFTALRGSLPYLSYCHKFSYINPIVERVLNKIVPLPYFIGYPLRRLNIIALLAS